LTDKGKLDLFMLDMLADAICKTSGINRDKHKQYTDAQTDQIEKLECDVFHFGFFSDLIAGDTKAEGKALMNSIIPKEQGIKNQVSELQLRLTAYIFYKAMYDLTRNRIDIILQQGGKRRITPEHIKKSDEIAQRISDLILGNMTRIKRENTVEGENKTNEAEKRFHN
jgi:hypothetical protein